MLQPGIDAKSQPTSHIPTNSVCLLTRGALHVCRPGRLGHWNRRPGEVHNSSDSPSTCLSKFPRALSLDSGSADRLSGPGPGCVRAEPGLQPLCSVCEFL